MNSRGVKTHGYLMQHDSIAESSKTPCIYVCVCICWFTYKL